MENIYYYDGTKLLSMLDLNNKRPEIYMCTSNRTAGKTTYFSRLLVNAFLKRGEKFALIYRYKVELEGCADKFFKDINGLFFPEYSMKAAPREKGAFYELFIAKNESEEGYTPCGYALALNSCETIKKCSHLLSDVTRMFMDEFQSETNNYCPEEIKKFISIHTSVARGNKKQVRYLPVIMCANPVTIINPYYVSLGISARLRDDTKFLKGDGFVLEQGYNESAALSQETSAFNRAFAGEKYVAYAGQGVYLNDSKAFIENPSGRNRYVATIRYKGSDYSLREYMDNSIIYVDTTIDSTFRFKISVTTEDHNINYIMLKRNEMFISNMRYYFERGCFRFKNLSCKEALMSLICY